MIKRFCSLAAIAVVSAAFVAGCGSSSSSSSSSSSAAPASSSTSTSASSSASSTSTGGIAGNPQVAAAIAQCKSRIAAVPTLTADSKTKLQSLCDAAANDPSAANIKKISSEVCIQIIKDSVPASVQQQALASCPKP